MKKNKIYVTTMYKHGDRDSHSYVLYAGFSKRGAIDAGKEDTTWRGNKYEFEVVEFTPGRIISKKIICSKLF